MVKGQTGTLSLDVRAAVDKGVSVLIKNKSLDISQKIKNKLYLIYILVFESWGGVKSIMAIFCLSSRKDPYSLKTIISTHPSMRLLLGMTRFLHF